MSLRNNKKSVFSTIGSYSTIGGDWTISQDNDTLASLNENRQPLSFLMDVLKVTVGSEATRLLIGELLVNITDNIEVELKKQLIEQLIDYNSDDDLPLKFINDGIEIPVVDIDIFSKLKTDPNSDIGALLFGKINEITFDKSAYDAIITEEETTYNNITIEYNEDFETFLFKPNIDQSVSEITIGEWIADFVNNTTLIEKDVFIAQILNHIFGSITSNQNKSTEKIFEELKIEGVINKIYQRSQELEAGDELLEIDDDVELDSEEILTADELTSLYFKAENIKRGVITYRVGCDYAFSDIELKTVNDLVDVISTTTNPYRASEILEREGVRNARMLVENEDGSLLVDDESEIIGANRETISDNFISNCIDAVNLELIKAITLTPQILTLISINNAFKNDCVHVKVNPNEYIEKNKKFIRCIIRDITREINKFIFNLVVTYLQKLIKPIIKTIIKEKFLAYRNILKSLIRG